MCFCIKFHTDSVELSRGGGQAADLSAILDVWLTSRRLFRTTDSAAATPGRSSNVYGYGTTGDNYPHETQLYSYHYAKHLFCCSAIRMCGGVMWCETCGVSVEAERARDRRETRKDKDRKSPLTHL